MRKLVLGISSLLCLGACGGKFGATRASTDGTAGGGAAGMQGSSTTEESGRGGSGGSSTADATSDLAGASSNDETPPCCKDTDLYQCGTGSCHPDTEYCFNAIDATGHSELGCQPIPKQCLASPQCACIASIQPSSRACQCADESVVRVNCFAN